MTRLKYYSVAGVLVTDWFTIAPNLIIRGVINSLSLEYFVQEFDSGQMKEGKADSLRSAKATVKKLLLEAGVNFDGEIRKRK